ncbi:hypothetical protein [Alkaliphilus hydrothermalis]|uniref:Uncharacterized protein n=1 Tax=Alkaliphilus hydrothermalis TaxID=1482730 RepID=A0ABS2NTP0_9FIRM|nr:hypothetical protein [Alkaliphilus hydrothermalis]MBM7616323.1 hypothetical protein [Alkaliphilus hydrothermalis]
MQILQFRPYKKFNKEELLSEIDRMRQQMNPMETTDPTMLDYLNKLFSEAKLRELSLNEKDICDRILYTINNEE